MNCFNSINLYLDKKIKKSNQISYLYFLLLKCFFFLFFFILFFKVLFGVSIVKDNEMHPKILSSDLIFYSRIYKNINVSNVVIYDIDGITKVGRIIAKPGDEVKITEQNTVSINNSVVNENDIFFPTKEYESRINYPLKLNKNEYFVLSDHRDGSMDSRYYGPINKSMIKGKVITLVRKNRI